MTHDLDGSYCIHNLDDALDAVYMDEAYDGTYHDALLAAMAMNGVTL